MTNDDQNDQDESGTVAGAVAKRDEAVGIEARLKRHEEWFDTIMPAHMPARQMIALSMGQFGKVKDLKLAAQRNPQSFMAAVAECARLALVPGDTAFYVPFKDKHAPGGYAVTLMIHWRGEAELVFRTGEVETIVCSEIRKGDHFAWAPSRMRVPEHEIPEGEDTGQVGLCAPAERGPLTGAYCYVIFKDGGTSYPTVMHHTEIRKHYDKAKSRDFWGEWGKGTYHQEPAAAWTVDMFKKTVLKKHSDTVPKSPEYLRAKAAAEAHVAETIPPEISAALARQAEIEDGRGGDPLDAPGTDGEDGERLPNPRTIAGAVEATRTGGKPPKGQRARDVATVNEILRDNGIDDREAIKLIVATAASEDPDHLMAPMLPAGLDEDQAARAAVALTGTVRELEQRGKDIAEGLLSIAQARGWNVAAATADA